MRPTILIISFLIFLVSCGPSPLEKEGSISYKRGGEACINKVKNHWLVDIKASNAADSVYLNTIKLKRKVELHRLRLDSNTSLFKVLSETCEGDSIFIKTEAIEFYKSLGGSVPNYLNDSDQINVDIWMRDQLDDLEHIAFKKLFEINIIEKYVSDNRWNGTKDSSTMIYFEKLKRSKRTKYKDGKAKISYVIKALNDNIIARSQDNDHFVYDPNDKSILGGIHFIMSKLSQGESGRAIVPSDQAFGSDGNSKVSGYTPIIIEIEVLEEFD